MKLLFSHYVYLINELTDLAWHLGFKSNLSLHFCLYLKCKGRPIYPSRSKISIPEMKALVRLATDCFNDIFYFVKVLGI